MSTLTEGQQLGSYRIVRILGEGGMGAVYEARQEPLNRRVALKTLHSETARLDDAVARFFNEAKILSQLEHPSIVQVSDFGVAEDGTAYLVMEFLRGQSLGRRLRGLTESGGQLSITTSLQFAFQVADVLATAHVQGIVHRDIKPDNLMLVADAVAPGGERVKVLDFGIAKLVSDGDKGGVRTATQAVLGTPSYMSPEQCAGAGHVDDKTDVYALGCVLFEMLTGRPPFVAEGAGQLIGMHLFQEPPALRSLAPQVPGDVADFIHRLLTKDKASRPTMSDAADEIGRLFAKHTGREAPARTFATIVANDDAKTVPSPVALSTLGRGVGQSHMQRSWRGQTLRLAGVGVAVVLLSTGLALVRRPPRAVVLSSKDMSTSTAYPISNASSAPLSMKPNPPEARSVIWHLDSKPTGATIWDDKDRSLGKTPIELQRTAQPGSQLLRFRRPGYDDRMLYLSTDHNTTQFIELKPHQIARPVRPSVKENVSDSALVPQPSKNSAQRRIGFED